MHGSRQICEDKNGDRVFVRFLNIRDSNATYSNLADRGWFANYISPREYSQVGIYAIYDKYQSNRG